MPSTETHTLPHPSPPFTHLHLTAFRGVSNASALRARLIAAASESAAADEKRAMDWCFVDGRMVTSREHLLLAVQQALIAHGNSALRTRGIHGEILFCLSPSANITDSLRNFGVNESTSTLVLMRLSSSPDGGEGVASVVEGDQVSVDEVLGRETDWPKVRKLYKLNALGKRLEGEQGQKEVDRLVCTTVAMKSVAS